jgi:hypothetical protein
MGPAADQPTAGGTDEHHHPARRLRPGDRRDQRRHPLQAVGGATAIANGVELTTDESGCVIFGAIPSTKANVEVKKINDVMENGSYRKVTEELPIVPSITTHYPVTLAPAGYIKGTFTNEGKSVPGDTFVASNNNIKETPNYELGSTRFAEPEKSGQSRGISSADREIRTGSSDLHELRILPPRGSFPAHDRVERVRRGLSGQRTRQIRRHKHGCTDQIRDIRTRKHPDVL